jgi:rod shape-determining protein MreC
VKERWNHLLLGILLLGQLILLSTQEPSRGSLLERWILGALAPFVHGVSATSVGVESFFSSFRLAGALRVENRELHRANRELRAEVVRLQGIEEELKRHLRTTEERFDQEGFYPAEVIYIDRGSWLRTLVLYTGSQIPQRNQPVVTARGLVGRIVTPASPYAKVLLLTDRSASVSAMLERTRRQGMVRGGGGEALILDNIPLLEEVRPGDQVITAGIDGVFPRGIPIGTVTAVEPGVELFHRIRVRPAIDFGLLDQVYVVNREVLPAVTWERLDAPVPEGGP